MGLVESVYRPATEFVAADGDRHAGCLCVDEKSQIQALGPNGLRFCRCGPVCQNVRPMTTNATEPRPCLPAFNILNGKGIGSCLPRHRGKEFLKFLNQVEKEVPSDLDVHIVLDNYSTHKSAAVPTLAQAQETSQIPLSFHSDQ
jgi:hypothetical protein